MGPLDINVLKNDCETGPWWHGSKKLFKLSHDREQISLNITKTYLYNFDLLKPHFYIVKLGSTGVYIIFRISAQNIDCGYSLEPPRRGGSNEYHNLCFEQKHEKYQIFLSKNNHFLVVKFSVYLNSRVFSWISVGRLKIDGIQPM